MFSLMLDPQLKNLRLVFSFVGREQDISIIEKYDQKFLQPMLLKCYHHLHLVVDCDVEFTKHRSYEDNNLDILEMTSSTTKLVIELVNRELLIFRKFQVDLKEIKCLLQWWQKHETMFPTIGFLTRQILGIVESQTKIEMIFFFR